MDTFFAGVQINCDRILEIISRGPLDEGDDDRQRIIAALSQVLTAELACAQRYRHEYQLAATLHGEEAAKGFLDYAAEEKEHVGRVGDRIVELGGQLRQTDGPTTKAEQSEHLEDMMKSDFETEKLLIETYRALARWLEQADPETAAMMQSIADDEQRHLTAP